MNGWEWTGTAPGTETTYLGDDEDRARDRAETWLKANPAGQVTLGQVFLSDLSRSLEHGWYPAGLRERSKRRDGRVVWERVSPGALAAAK